jgi:hypothetical protein
MRIRGHYTTHFKLSPVGGDMPPSSPGGGRPGAAGMSKPGIIGMPVGAAGMPSSAVGGACALVPVRAAVSGLQTAAQSKKMESKVRSLLRPAMLHASSAVLSPPIGFRFNTGHSVCTIDLAQASSAWVTCQGRAAVARQTGCAQAAPPLSAVQVEGRQRDRPPCPVQAQWAARLECALRGRGCMTSPVHEIWRGRREAAAVQSSNDFI